MTSPKASRLPPPPGCRRQVGTRSRTRTLAAIVAAAFAITGCLASPPPEDAPPDGPGLAVNVAALALSNTHEVCYGVAVENGQGEPVWQQSNLCSGQFGNGPGGAISYIGPCDASPGADRPP